MVCDTLSYKVAFAYIGVWLAVELEDKRKDLLIRHLLKHDTR